MGFAKDHSRFQFFRHSSLISNSGSMHPIWYSKSVSHMNWVPFKACGLIWNPSIPHLHDVQYLVCLIGFNPHLIFAFPFVWLLVLVEMRRDDNIRKSTDLPSDSPPKNSNITSGIMGVLQKWSECSLSVPSALEIFRWFVCFDGDDKRMTASSASQPASPRANSDYCLPPPQALIILPRQGAVLQVHIPAVCVTHGHTNRHKHTNRNINTDTDLDTQKHFIVRPNTLPCQGS